MYRTSTVLILAIISTFFETNASERYMQLVAKADSVIALNMWDKAEMLITEALSDEPDNPSNPLLLSNLGMVRFYQGKDSLAISTLDKAHALAPASVTVLTNRSRVYAMTGRTENAYRDLCKIIEIDSLFPYAFMMRGLLSLELGDTLTAKSDLSHLKRIAPDDIDTHVALASYYKSTNDIAECINELGWLIENEPSAIYYGERAMLRLSNGDLNEASQDIAEGMRLDPEDPILWLYRAMLNKMRYRPEDAKADIKQAEKLGINPDIVRQLGL